MRSSCWTWTATWSRPTLPASGDFYDVFACGAAWGFAIVDVSGKGAQAAAVTALARYTLRALSSRDAGPRRSVAQLNEHLLAGGAEETYLTVAHGRFTAAAEKVTVRFVLGGHPHPMLVRAGSGEVLAAGLPATGLTDRVLAAVLDFQDQHAADDIALLVIQAPQVEPALRPRRFAELVAP